MLSAFVNDFATMYTIVFASGFVALAIAHARAGN
jgi:hypothetical protein